MEITHAIKITVEVDTNKATYRDEFDSFESLITWLYANGYLPDSVDYDDFETTRFEAGEVVYSGNPPASDDEEFPF